MQGGIASGGRVVGLGDQIKKRAFDPKRRSIFFCKKNVVTWFKKGGSEVIGWDK